MKLDSELHIFFLHELEKKKRKKKRNPVLMQLIFVLCSRAEEEAK